MKLKLFLGEILLVVGFYLCTGRPTPEDNHVTMSGEPTHFQVDDKAAELEINANAMGVKVNAKPASLQVVSKPGAPSVPVAHPAVVVPQLPAPYLPAPFYPAPAIFPEHHPVRKHHFFMDSGNGNYNFKKASVPKHNISKKSEIFSKDRKSKKRQWIQRLPLLSQIVPYAQLTNVRVHPLVQQMIALAQGQARQNIPRLIAQIPQLSQRYSIAQRIPGMLPIPQGMSMVNSQPRSMVHRAVFIPPTPMYAPPTMPTFAPYVNQRLYFNPSGIHNAISGYNGYYDPMISRDFIPGLGSPNMPLPLPRTFIPEGVTGGVMYPGITPLGPWQRVSKRLTIPHLPSTNHNTPPTKKTLKNNRPGGEHHEITTPKEKSSLKKSRIRRSMDNLEDKNKHKKSDSVAKRQFILTRPVVPQRVVTYVPVVLSPQTHPTMMAALPGRRNLVLNLPSKTSSQFVLKVPSDTAIPQVSPRFPNSPVALYQPLVAQNVQSNAMGLQRSAAQTQNPVMQMPGVQRSSSPFSLAELAGMQGQMSYRRSPHMTLYSTDPLLSQFQDQIFGGSSLEGRARIPRRHDEQRRRLADLSGSDREYAYSEDEPYIDEDRPTSRSLLNHIDDQGSYTEQILPDGRTVFRKHHVGFGPITVEAKTAASRDHADVTDMDLDSDKRKLIPRPKLHSNLDKRLGIPKPER